MHTGTRRRFLFAGLTLLLLCSAANAVPYALDSGVIGGGLSVPDVKYANRFVINDQVGQMLDSIQVKQPLDPDPTGTCDVYLWAANAGGSLPGTVLASVMNVTVPQGTEWTTIDFSAQRIALPVGTIVFAGVVTHDLYAYFDDSGGNHSFRQLPDSPWTIAPIGGYLMVRMNTFIDPTPTAPTNLDVTPVTATLGDRLRATASGSQSADPGAIVTYQYEWAQSVNGGPWSDFTVSGASVSPDKLVVGDRWKARARSKIATGETSPWIESGPVWIRAVIGRARPADGDTNVQRKGVIQIIFRWPMVQSSVESSFTCTPAGGSPVTGTFTWTKIGVTLRFTPDKALAPNTVYTVKIAKGVVRRGPLQVNVDTTYSFTTGSMPVVLSWAPKGEAVPVTTKVVVGFDKPIGASSVSDATFRLSPYVAGTFTVVDKTVTFTPTKPLKPATRYFVGLSGQIATPLGRIMGRSFSWNFKTAAAAAPGALAVTAAAVTSNAGPTQFTVNLTAAASVGVQITNIAGQTIATLAPRELDQGVSTLLWDGRSAHGTKVPSGRYFARLAASAPSGEQVHVQTAFERR